MALEAIREAFMRWMALPNPNVVDILAGTIIGNRLSGPPLFMVIVGPSGSGKSEYIEAMNGLDGAIPLSKMTPSTLVSGLKETDASLLKRLTPDKAWILLMKDLTTVLSERRDDRNKILGQLREVYDGHFSAKWGTGEAHDCEWKGKLGILAACTGVYDQVSAHLAALGQRFLVYKPEMVSRSEMAQRAVTTASRDPAMKDELRQAVKELDTIAIPQDVPMSPDVRAYVVKLCGFLAYLRTPVLRNALRELLAMPEVEGTGRIAKQFTQLLKGITIARGVPEPGDEEVRLLEEVALGSVPTVRLEVARNLSLTGDSINQLQARSRIPHTLIWRVLEDFKVLGLVEQNKLHQYQPAPKYEVFFHVAQRRSNGQA